MKKKADQPPTPSFVATFELESNSAGFCQLDKMLNAYRQLYNATLGELQRRLKRARKSAEWETGRNLPKGSAERKAAFTEARKKYGLSSGEAQNIAARMVTGHFTRLTNSRIVQQIAKRAWGAIEKVMFGKAKRVRFKRRDEFHSFETNANDTGIQVSPTTGTVGVGRHLRFQFKADGKNPYHVHALGHRVKFSRILKHTINGVPRWSVQMVLEGRPYRDFKKHITQPGERVGLDLGPARIAVATEETSFQQTFCPGLDRKQAEIRRLQRRMDRSRRANNPYNYTQTGTIKKGRKTWKNSTRYHRLRSQLADLERRKAAHRTSLHGQLVHRVLKFGNQIHLEKVSYRGWQKQYGTAVGHQAPSGFVTHLIRLAAMHGGGAVEINPYQTCLSQLCVCGHKHKKKVSERAHSCQVCGFQAPRDEWSAFLALHTTCINGKWVVNLDAARLGLLRHRTLASGLEAIPGPCAVAAGVVGAHKRQAPGVASGHGVPHTVGASRTTAGKRSLEPPVDGNGNGSGCGER